jgi:hypothetical protein
MSTFYKLGLNFKKIIFSKIFYIPPKINASN